MARSVWEFRQENRQMQDQLLVLPYPTSEFSFHLLSSLEISASHPEASPIHQFRLIQHLQSSALPLVSPDCSASSPRASLMRRTFSLLQISSRQIQPPPHWPTGQSGASILAEQPTMPQSCEYESRETGRLKQGPSWMHPSAQGKVDGQTGVSSGFMSAGWSPGFSFNGLALKFSRSLAKLTCITLCLDRYGVSDRKKARCTSAELTRGR